MYRCPYCKGEINKSDINCPNCGAKISEILNYDYNQRLQSSGSVKARIGKNFRFINIAPYLLVFIWTMIAPIALIIIILKDYRYIGIIIAIICVILTIIILLIKKRLMNSNRKLGVFNYNKGDKNYSILCDEVKEIKVEKEWYTFGNQITVCQEGYYPVALHIIVNNYSETPIRSFSEKNKVSLLIDGVTMVDCPVGNDKNIYRMRYLLSRNKPIDDIDNGIKSFYESYSMKDVNIPPNSTYEGWVGFFIPKGAKNFEIRFGKEVYIMDNPLNDNTLSTSRIQSPYKCLYCGEPVFRDDGHCKSCGALVSLAIDNYNIKEIDYMFNCNKIDYYKIIHNDDKIARLPHAIKNHLKDDETSKKMIEIAADFYYTKPNYKDIDIYYLNREDKGMKQVAFHIIFTNIGLKELRFVIPKKKSEDKGEPVLPIMLFMDDILLEESCIMTTELLGEKGYSEEDNKEYLKFPDKCNSQTSIEGWIGFYVPMDAKKLKLVIGSKELIIDENLLKK